MDAPDNVREFILEAAWYKAMQSYDLSPESLERDGDFEKCESPIEQLLYVALEACLKVNFRKADTGKTQIAAGKKIPGEGVHVLPQWKIGQYRVDFLVAHMPYCNGADEEPEFYRWIVECDGHDFHERTKAQAARDKRRDRELTGKGFKVLRFTGSEIHQDPFGVAIEILTLVLDHPCSDPRQYASKGTRNA